MKIKTILLAALFVLTLSVICGCVADMPNNETDTKSGNDIKTSDTDALSDSEPETTDKVDSDFSYNGLFSLTQEEADEKFAEILDGLFTGKTTEVMDKRSIGSRFSMHFPDMIYKDGVYYAYYITYSTSSGKGGVGLAISLDGLDFADCGCVIAPDEDYDRNGAYFAGVWIDDDGTFYLAYECKGGEKTKYGTLENIAYASSKDGRNWKKEGILLYKNTKLTWQKANIGTPELYKKDGIWYVFFHGYDYDTCQIGVAYGKDLTDLKMVDEPIIPTKAGTPYGGTTGRRDIIHIGEWYYMVYEVSTEATADGYGGASWTHMFARSKDLLEWETVEAPLLTQQKTGFGYDGPCWCIADGHIYVYFRVGSSTRRAELVLK